jgi:crossover junction endodeoxyribonuclease RuvC
LLVLGIDPGLTRCGVGIISATKSKRSLIAVETIRSSPELSIEARLLAIGSAIDALIEHHEPELVAVERVFAQHNLRSVTGTAQVSGLALFQAARRGIPVSYYTPSEVKAAVTGNGRADKAQVGFMVKSLLGLDEIPKPADAADSLAIALCAVLRPQQTSNSETAAQRVWRNAARAAAK